MPPLKRITAVQTSLIRESGYNSPHLDDCAGKALFCREFGGIRSDLSDFLSHFYRLGHRSGDELFLTSDIFITRVLYLEVVCASAIRECLPRRLWEFLSTRREDYRIAVCESYFLQTKEGAVYPAFYLMVTRDAVAIHTESPETLAAFGVYS